MYSYQLRKGLEKDFVKLAKKSPSTLRSVSSKIKEIVSCKDCSHYKNLRKPLSHLKRVHINKSFVLVFSVNEESKQIIFEEFDHHDKIYK